MHSSCMGSPLPIVHAEWSLTFGLFGSCFELMTIIMIMIASFVFVFVGIHTQFAHGYLECGIQPSLCGKAEFELWGRVKL